MHRKRIILIVAQAPPLSTDRRGVSAVEFALIAPLFLLLTFGILAFSTVLGTYAGLQQIAAEAARASVAGLSDSERAALATQFVQANAGAYPFIDPARLTVSTGPADPAGQSYRVALRYDMSNSFVFRFGEMLPLPSPIIVRTAAVQRGGF